MGLRDKYDAAIQAAKGHMEGSADEREGKLYFRGTVKTEPEANRIWDAIKTVADWRNDVIADIKVVAGKATPAPEAERYTVEVAGIETKREKEIGQHIGYRYDVNLVPDYSRLTPFLKKYMETMGWKDLNWLEDVHLGYEEGQAAVFDRNINGWVTVPEGMALPEGQQDRDMIARELLIKFQMSQRHPMVDLRTAYRKF